MIANNSTNNHVVFFFVSYLKIVYYNSRSQCLGQERKKDFRPDLFGDKIIQNCLKIEAIHSYDDFFITETRN